MNFEAIDVVNASSTLRIPAVDRVGPTAPPTFEAQCPTSNHGEFAAKPLQVDTWLGLLLTAYRKLSPPYPVVPSQTPCDLLFSHNTSVTDGRTDDNDDKWSSFKLTA